MTLCVAHVLDEMTAQDSVRQLGRLLRRTGEDRHVVLHVGPRPAALGPTNGVPVVPLPRSAGRWWSFEPAWKRALGRHRPDVMHAWGPSASARVSDRWAGQIPLLTTLADAREATQLADRYHVQPHSGPWRVVCPTDRIIEALLAGGFPASLVRRIPPPVDTETIRQAAERASRSRWGLPPIGRVFLTPSPPSRAGGHFLAAWAMAILHQIWPEDVLVIPGDSAEGRRLDRLFEGIYCPQVFYRPGEEASAEALLAVADVLLVAAAEEIPADWIPLAMAAGVAVIACDVPATRDWIRDGRTGALAPAGRPHALATRIRCFLEEEAVVSRCRAEARNLATRLCDIAGAVKAYRELYRSLVEAAVGLQAG